MTWRLRISSASDCWDGETTRGSIEYEERADADAAGSGEGSAGVEAVGASFDVDAVGGKVGVVAAVLDLVDGVAEDGGLAGQAAESDFGDINADAGLEPDAVGADERDGRDGSVAELRGQPDDVVEDGIGGGVEHLVLMEGFDPESFVFDQESVHLTS